MRFGCRMMMLMLLTISICGEAFSGLGPVQGFGMTLMRKHHQIKQRQKLLNITMLMKSDDPDHWMHNEYLIDDYIRRFPDQAQQVVEARKNLRESDKQLNQLLDSQTEAVRVAQAAEYSKQLIIAKQAKTSQNKKDIFGRNALYFQNKIQRQRFLLETRKLFIKVVDYTDKDIYTCQKKTMSTFEYNSYQLDKIFYENLEKATTFFLSLATLIVCSFITLSVFTNKKIKEAHPSKLIALISLTELFSSWSMMVWQLGSIDFFCYTKISDMYLYTKQYTNPEFTEMQSLQSLERWNRNIFEFFQILGIMFNSFLCIDLYLTYKTPFYPIDRRIKNYIISGTIIGYILFMIADTVLLTDKEIYDQFLITLLQFKITIKDSWISLQDDEKILANAMQSKNNYIEKELRGQLFMCVVMVTYILIAAMSLGFAKQANTQRNISKGNFILSKYLNNFKKYIKGLVFMTMFFLAFTFYEMNYYQKLLSQHNQVVKNGQNKQNVELLSREKRWEEIKQTDFALMIFRVIIYIQLIQGIVLGLLRAREPFFSHLIMREFRAWFGIPESRVSNQDEAQMAASFGQMNQAISVDMIKAILYSITKHTVGESKMSKVKEGEKSLNWMDLYHAYDFDNQNVTVIDFIIEEEVQDDQFMFDEQDNINESPEKQSETQLNNMVEQWAQQIYEIKKSFTSMRMHSQDQNNVINYMECKRNSMDKGRHNDISRQFKKMKTQVQKKEQYLRAWTQLKIMDKKTICIEFAPDIFAHLRNLDNFENQDLPISMNPFLKANREAIIKSGEGMGKSGSFFFFSHDKKLLIKTMTTDDFNAFMKLFRKYFEHVNQFPESIIARIYGVYQVKMGDQSPVYLVLMGNCKNTPDEFVRYCFDLKGSMVSREVHGTVKNTYCLKDKNLLKLKDRHNFLRFKESDVRKIMRQIALDVSLMNLFNLMDYSLLLCVQYRQDYIERNQADFEKNPAFKCWEEKDTDGNETIEEVKYGNETINEVKCEITKQNEIAHGRAFAEEMLSTEIEQKVESSRQAPEAQESESGPIAEEGRDRRHQFLSSDGKYVYHISIIDYLQDFNLSKKGENKAKSIANSSNGHLISAVPPKQYCERFFNFMKDEVIIDQSGFQ